MNARNNAVDAQQEAAKNPDDGKRIQRLGGADTHGSLAFLSAPGQSPP